jgi:hypothetical protein
VTAQGKLAARYELSVADENDDKRVEIGLLVDGPLVNGTANQAGGSRPLAGYAIAGVGLFTLSAGVVFGALSLSKRDDARSLCAGTGPEVDGQGHCYAQTSALGNAKTAMSTARTFATASDVLVPLGVVAAAVGAYLVITSNKAEKKPSARLSPTPFGAMIDGTF